MSTNKSLERRDFFKGAAVGAAGLAVFGLAGCDAPKEAAKASEGDSSAETASLSWDKEADVIVVGAGGAGLAAAYEASRAGASTLVLEKNSIIGGTTALSAGVTQAAGTSFQKEFTDDQDDTPEKHFEFYKAVGEGLLVDELAKDLAFGCPEVIRWYTEDLGLEIEGLSSQSHFPHVPAELQTTRIHRPKDGGTAITTAVHSAAEEAGAEFILSVEATELVLDATGAVIGVKAEGKEGAFTAKANKGVILCAGGVDRNVEMARKHSPSYSWVSEISDCVTTPTNTGDGINMGLKAGGEFVCDGGGGATLQALKLKSGNPIWTLLFVDKTGQRYTCEDAHYAYMIRMQYMAEKSHNHPCYAVWGESNLANCVPWDASTINEAVASGLVISASSLEELAHDIGVNATGLQNTVDYWNSTVAPSGVDEQFGRKSGFETIEGSTYYANRILFDNMGSSGGLAIDVEARVLYPDGTPIPGLYAAGMNTGGVTGAFYPGSGTAMANNFHFGRKAGRNAASA